MLAWGAEEEQLVLTSMPRNACVLCRVQLPCVGLLEKLTMGLSSSSTQAAWLLEQVEVTDEATGGCGG
jgi:hypothetical protein